MGAMFDWAWVCVAWTLAYHCVLWQQLGRSALLILTYSSHQQKKMDANNTPQNVRLTAALNYLTRPKTAADS